MKYGRTYNFSAGPAMMPESVLEEIAAEMMKGRGTRAIPVFALVLLPLFVFLSLVLCRFLERNKMTPHRVLLYLFVQPQDIVSKCQQDCFS